MNAHAGMCLCVFFSPVCPHFCQWAHVHLRAVMTVVCVWICACVYEGEGGRKVSKVPRRNNEGKWIPDGLFFLFSLCCQWREGSDKPIMGNRLAHSSFELFRQHRATESSLSPPQDSISVPNNNSIKLSLHLFEVHKKHWASIMADKTIWLCQVVRSNFRLCSFTTETMVLCQFCLSCWVWYQPNLGFTCHVNYDCRFVHKYLSSLGDCPIWKSAVKFENSSISLNITESFHQHTGKKNPVSDVTVVMSIQISLKCLWNVWIGRITGIMLIFKISRGQISCCHWDLSRNCSVTYVIQLLLFMWL